MHINVHTNIKGSIWDEAKLFLADLLKDHQGEKILLLLSGGSAVRLYESIKYQISSMKYENIAFAQVDERFKPKQPGGLKLEIEDINVYQIEKTGLLEVCREKNIPYCLISQKGALEEATQKYNEQLEKLFGESVYKIAILGIGKDAHTAGLLPGFESSWNVKKYAVGYDLRQNASRGAFCRGGFPFRISVTPMALKLMDQAIVVATGEKKRDALKTALDIENRDKLDDFPAVILQKIKKVDLFTDM